MAPTVKQVRKYIENDGMCCPYCESRNISQVGERLYSCSDCEMEWEDCYAEVLTGVDDVILMTYENRLLEILKIIVEHAEERYPHFESDRGKTEIATAKLLIAEIEGE